MTSQTQTSAKPTSRQLAFIRDLNSKTGTEFPYPALPGRPDRRLNG